MKSEEINFQSIEKDIQFLLTPQDDSIEFLSSLRGQVLQKYSPRQTIRPVPVSRTAQ